VRRVCLWESYEIGNLLIDNLVEFATVGKTKDGQIYHHLWSADEITALLKEHDLAKADTGNDGN